MSTEVNRRNTETVEKTLQEQNKKMFEMQTQINGLNNSMSVIMNRLNSLEQLVIQYKIKSMGTGASVVP